MLETINTTEDYNKIRTQISKEWCRIIDYQMKMAVIHGLSWVLCTNCNAEFESTLRTLREKERFISKIWDKKFSFKTIMKKLGD